MHTNVVLLLFRLVGKTVVYHYRPYIRHIYMFVSRTASRHVGQAVGITISLGMSATVQHDVFILCRLSIFMCIAMGF